MPLLGPDGNRREEETERERERWEDEEGGWETLVFTESALTYLPGISRMNVCVCP